MNKYELNQYAISLGENAFQKQGFIIEKPSVRRGPIDFIAVSNSGRRTKVKVRAISQMGSYVFIKKTKFNIQALDLYMAVVYIPHSENERILYLVPAIEWGKNIYPCKGKDYDKPNQKSDPEWGISFSQKAKDAMEQYQFHRMIASVM